MALAAALLQQRNIPFGVVINKHDANNTLIDDFCTEKNLPVLARIPYSREAAVCYSKGKMLIDIPELRGEFSKIASGIAEVM